MRLLLHILALLFLFTACKQVEEKQEDQSGLNGHAFEEQLSEYENPERDRWQKPEAVIQLMEPLSGKVVVDIGAGSGYFSFPLAQKAEKVIAIDIDERFLQWINERSEKEHVHNIETRRTKDYDPLLSQGEADEVIMVDVYHHIEERVPYLRKVKKGLKSQGTLWIIDFKQGQLPVGPPAKMKLDPEKIIEEIKTAGFKEISVNDTLLPYQYILKAR